MNPQFDVFKGTQENPMWLGSVRGLSRAIELMNRMAEVQPGDYFVLSSLGKRVMAAVHPEPAIRQEPESAAAPAFDIFKGSYPNQEAIWLETVQGLAKARQRMEQIAFETPGSYFVFSTRENLVMAMSDTTRRTSQVLRADTKVQGAA